MKERLKTLWKAWTTYSGRESRRALLLVPLLVLIALLFLWQGKPRFERSFTMYADRTLDSQRTAGRSRPAGTVRPEFRTTDKKTETPVRDSLFVFDPNTISGEELVRLGFSERQADVILRYRNAGAVFREPSDFARCYTVSQARFRQLEPYIRIGRAFAGGGKTSGGKTGTGLPDTTEVRVVPDVSKVPDTSGLSGRRGPVEKVPRAVAAVVFPVELNDADSATLVAVRGIGPLTAGRIVRYRHRLGGFARVEQLREVQGMTDQNYSLILQQICVDSSKIRKIDINFALPLQLRDHPYLPERVLNRLLKYRQLKGGWRSIGDLTEQHIISEQQAEKLSPYLCFRVQ